MNKPQKVCQVAALFRLVFEANLGVRMTRSQIEECVNVEGFSASTRQRALNVLAIEKVIRYERSGWGGETYVYWMPSVEKIAIGLTT